MTTLPQKVWRNTKALKPSTIGVIFIAVGVVIWGVHEAAE